MVNSDDMHADQERSEGHWFETLASHMGPAYLRYSFTKGTAQEVEALISILGLTPGDRVLDVGCGPGRHSLALAEQGMNVVGVDISNTFVELGNEAALALPVGSGSAEFVVADARELDFHKEFDAVISLCQGAFGLAGGAGARDLLPARELDEPILDGIGRALRSGGKAAVSAFSAYFQVQFLERQDDFDALRGVNHEKTAVRDEVGASLDVSLWTSCFTPRELRLLARAVGLDPISVFGVTPGVYGPTPPTIDQPEFLLVAVSP